MTLPKFHLTIYPRGDGVNLDDTVGIGLASSVVNTEELLIVQFKVSIIDADGNGHLHKG